jgi:xanthine dehydrogenase large subunit
LFPAEVAYHAQPVAWVLGETLEAARLGAARVSVEYRALAPVLTIEDAIAAGSFHSGPHRIRRGDTSEAMARSPHRVTGRLAMGGQEHFYLETQCAIARLDETGGVIVDSSTQHPCETQEVVARVLGLARHQVTVQCLRMGGAFGGKEVQASPWAAVAALRDVEDEAAGARAAAAPSGYGSDRETASVSGKVRRRIRRAGRAARRRVELYSDGGWSLDLSDPVLWRAIFHCDNAYLIPALDASGWVCQTHKTSQTAFRGFGGPQGMMVIEDILDRIARTLGSAPDMRARAQFLSRRRLHALRPCR